MAEIKDGERLLKESSGTKVKGERVKGARRGNFFRFRRGKRRRRNERGKENILVQIVSLSKRIAPIMTFIILLTRPVFNYFYSQRQ